MATIALYANKINQMPGLIKDVKQSVTDYKSELSALKTKTLTISKSVCNLDDVISSIQTSSQTQEQKIASLDTFNQNSETFISDVVRIDGNVADVVKQRKDDFYNKYNYLKPECEKNGWEKFCDQLDSVGDWCKKHWVELLVGIVCIVIGAVLTVLTGGAFLPALLAGLKTALIFAAISGGISAGISILGSIINGDDLGTALGKAVSSFFDGAATGFMYGGIFSGASAAMQGLAKISPLADKLIPAIKMTGKISFGLSLFPNGLDLLSAFDMIFDPESNPIADFNANLHSNALYNAFQTTANVISVTSAGALYGYNRYVKEWTDTDGSPKWPDGEKYPEGFDGKPTETTLEPGTKIDRYGYDGGSFASPEGTPYGGRSLAPGTGSKPYNVYEVTKPIPVLEGGAAPWFGQRGGGIQYKFSESIRNLRESGYLKEVTP